MGAAHGGQVLLSQAMVALMDERLPAGVGLRDLGAVRLRDLSSPEHVFQLTHPQLRQDFPALRSLAARPNNLPQQVTSFIGRESELADIATLLGETRLVTLLGVGGLGKTRLALQVGADVLDAYADGVWLVELAPLADAQLVAQAVASVLGVMAESGRPVVEALLKFVADRQLLLILDNCEHLGTACARLAVQLQQAGPQTTMLATSREPLHVAGETTYQLPTLGVPEAQPRPALDVLTQFAAVRLFVERARAALPAFRVTEQNATAVADICHRLDGIPLALELAAARVRALSIGQIDARLSDRFRLLTGGDRTALPRQQTLRACIDWSYNLLTEPERALLRRLAVFAGGWTLEAAEAVGAGSEVESLEVLDLLTHLVEKSLVERDAASDRYRLLETVRQYALEQLAAQTETAAGKGRHSTFFRNLFTRADAEWSTTPDAEWQAQYFPERDNLRVALDWALGPMGDNEIGIALAGASARLWVALALAAEGRQRLESALARITPATPSANEARCWFELAGLSHGAAYPRARAAYERAIALYRAQGDANGLGEALVRFGYMRAQTGQLESAEAALIEARPLLERMGQPRSLALWFEAYARVLLRSGRADAARSHIERALAHYRSVGAERKVLAMLANIADVDWANGDLDGAIAGFQEAIALHRRSSVARSTARGTSLANLAGALIERGDLEEALAAAREGLPLQREAGYAWVSFDHYTLRVALTGRHADAARLAGYTDAAYRAQGVETRPQNEARARARSHLLLQQKFTSAEIERLLAEGALLTENDACRIALED